MNEERTFMRREIEEIPAATDRFLRDGLAPVREAALTLETTNPAYLATVARGSSDHVAMLLKYACELTLGIPVASLGPSVASIYGRSLNLRHGAVVSISQSGRSPDIVSVVEAARAENVPTLAVTNDAASPLAAASATTLDICAGPERSVAATKTVVSSAVACLSLLAECAGDRDLKAALQRLPQAFEDALACDWSDLAVALSDRRSLYVLGRGPGFAVSNEAALKFKETCQVHAESYSSAEVLHGPVSIVEEGYPVLVLAVGDRAEPAVAAVADELAGRGAQVFITSALGDKAQRLPSASAGHPLVDPLVTLVSYYRFVEAFALARGLSPDTPQYLSKVTETV